MSAPSIETSEAGRELAYVMADALADCGCLRSAVAHLEAVEARRPLPLEYQRKRARWTGQDDVPARERPVLRAI